MILANMPKWHLVDFHEILALFLLLDLQYQLESGDHKQNDHSQLESRHHKNE